MCLKASSYQLLLTMPSLFDLKQRADERGMSYETNATQAELIAMLLPSPSDTSIDAKVERDWLLNGVVDNTYLSPEKSKPVSNPPNVTRISKHTRAATLQHRLFIA